MAARKRTTQAVRKPRTSAPSSSNKIAQAAVSNEGEPTRGGEVALTLRIPVSRAVAERLTALAISEGKNLNALVGEILEDVRPKQPSKPARPSR